MGDDDDVCVFEDPLRFGVLSLVCRPADVFNISTSLSLSFSHSLRHFDLKSPVDPSQAAALFSVPDFVGDACKAIASRVRGAVASVQFDDFHKVRPTLQSSKSALFWLLNFFIHFLILHGLQPLAIVVRSAYTPLWETCAN